jgi:ribonuclease HI
MKTLKLRHRRAEQILSGEMSSSWRMFDDKDMTVNDELRVVDQVDEEHPDTWRVIGTAHIDKIVEKLPRDLSAEELAEHNYSSLDEMLTTYRGYYGENVAATTPLKMIYFTFSPEKGGENVFDATYDTNKVKLYADGGSRGNPGPSASGFVIIDPVTNKVLVDKGVYLGVTTNNQAEYHALKLGLEEAKRMGAREVSVYLDSLLVVNQMNGQFKVSNRDLWPIHDAIKTTAESFEKVSFQHVPREQNKLADAAVNRALDEHLDKQVG